MDMERIARLEAEGARLRAEIERLESGGDGADSWTEADERAVERLTALAWAAEDGAAVLKASLFLQNTAFSALVLRTLDTMPAGPTNAGDPGVWHAGREFWAYEVIELAAAAAPHLGGMAGDAAPALRCAAIHAA